MPKKFDLATTVMFIEAMSTSIYVIINVDNYVLH